MPLFAALTQPPDADEQLTRPDLDAADPLYALAQFVEQHAKDFPDGFRIAAGAKDPVEELKAATSSKPNA